jgi:hypothetical protein
MSLSDKKHAGFVWDNDRCGVVQTLFLEIIFIFKKIHNQYQSNQIIIIIIIISSSYRIITNNNNNRANIIK